MVSAYNGGTYDMCPDAARIAIHEPVETDS